MPKVTSTHRGLNRGPLFRENQNQIDGMGREGGREWGEEETIEMIPSE
jgi:hypothetical protein